MRAGVTGTKCSPITGLAVPPVSDRADLLQYDACNARYREIIRRYDRTEVDCLQRMPGCLVELLEGGYKDALGPIFEALQPAAILTSCVAGRLC